MINLLPIAYREEIRREYFLRLAAVALCIAGVVFVAGASLLSPAYFFLYSEERELSQSEAVFSAQSGSSSIEELQAEYADLQKRAEILRGKFSRPTASEYIARLVDSKPEGVSIMGVEYESTPDGKTTLLIRGTSPTRERLVTFQKTLEDDPLFVVADIPLRDLANQRNITFSMTVTAAAL